MSAHLAEEKRRILQAALGHVAFDGWGGGTLARAVADCGYDRSMATRAFPGGTSELIDFFLRESDRRMLEELDRLDLPSLRIRERIATAVRTRLEQAAGQREAVRRAVAFQMLPGQGGRTLRALYRTVDAIWRACGDTATDFNFYTKRALLAGVYSSTLLFWLNDKSEGFVDTWAFLDRRIGEVMAIQKLRGRLSKLKPRLPDPWRALGRLRYRFSA
jgi:ubiquinone biosynthesis protein COQ9